MYARLPRRFAEPNEGARTRGRAEGTRADSALGAAGAVSRPAAAVAMGPSTLQCQGTG